MVKNKGKTQFYEKHCKNNEKIMKRFGSRTSTHPPGVLQRGNTTGKQKGNTTGKKWKNEKKYIYKF